MTGIPGPLQGDRAVVIGGSIAGLACAAELARRFRQVTVVERDRLAATGEHRRGVPQYRQTHLLLPAGLRGLTELLPGFDDALARHGVHVIDAAEIRFSPGGERLPLTSHDLAITGATRPVLEGLVRERVGALPNVRILDDSTVVGLAATADRSRITGVHLQPADGGHGPGTVAADLVVDAGGRGSRSPRWLAELGHPTPATQRIVVDVHYSTRLFRRDSRDLDGCRHAVIGMPPDGRRGGLVLAVEGDRWQVTLVGMLGERPPTDLDGFAAYAESLWADDVHRVVSRAEPIGDGLAGVFHEYLRRRYDRLRRFPDRYVVAGDAVCSLNPQYAQGMSVAVEEARALGRVLDRTGLDRVGQRFFRATRPLVDAAWSLSTGADLAHPQVVGPRPLSWRLLNAYVGRSLRVARHDPLVADAIFAVNTLVEPPPALLHPRVVRRVLHRDPTAAPRPEPSRPSPAGT